MESIRYRTFYPKLSTYGGDGSGRDSYIIFNNGGLVRPHSKNQNIVKRSGAKIWYNRSTPTPQSNAKSFRYHSNGSGRDFYVTFNSGGLHQPYTPGGKRDLFMDSLCNDPPNLRASRDDYLKRTQGWIAPRSRQSIRRKSKVMQDVVSRLSQSPSPCGKKTRPSSTDFKRRSVVYTTA